METQNETAPVILIDWSDSEGGIVKASRLSLEQVQAQSEKALNLAMGTIKGMAAKLARTIQQIDQNCLPDEAQVEFGIKLDVETGALISPLSKATGGAQLSVTFTWKIDRPRQATIVVHPNP